MRALAIPVIGAAGGLESCLRGSVTVPFPIVSAVIGLIVLGVLVYFAKRLAG